MNNSPHQNRSSLKTTHAKPALPSVWTQALTAKLSLTLSTVLGLGLFAASLIPTQLRAQDAAGNFPNKTVTLIVPYAPGGSSDTRARQIAQKLAGYWGSRLLLKTGRAAMATLDPMPSPSLPPMAIRLAWVTLGRWW